MAIIKTNIVSVRQKYKTQVILLILYKFKEVLKLFQTSFEGLLFIKILALIY